MTLLNGGDALSAPLPGCETDYGLKLILIVLKKSWSFEKMFLQIF